MKKIIYNACTFVFMLSVAAGFTSCSDDDDPQNPIICPVEDVFPEGVPAQVGDAVITTNADGRVASINDGEDIYTFEYLAAPVDGYNVIVRENSVSAKSRAENDGATFRLRVNNAGFIEHCYETGYDEYDGELYEQTWDFEYNAAGQLSKMKRSEGDNEVTVITYNGDGDIVKVSVTDDESTKPFESAISYGTTPIVNKGGIMLFDQCFNVDMDEMSVMYFAGLLGKGTRHLPTECNELEGEYSSRYTFTWDLNADGLPVKLTEKEYYAGSTEGYTQTMTFRW